jgi:hypothetical protein
MSLGQATTEAQDFLLGLGDANFLTESYTEVLRDLAKETGAFAQWKILDGAQNVNVYTLPATAIEIHQVVWFPEEIPQVDSAELEQADPAWKSTSGRPAVWLEDLQNATVFRVYPTPTVDGTRGLSSLMAPAAGIMPMGNPVVFFSEVPDDSRVFEWMTGPISMKMAAREAKRLGDQQDMKLAEALEQVAAALITMMFGLTNEGT